MLLYNKAVNVNIFSIEIQLEVCLVQKSLKNHSSFGTKSPRLTTNSTPFQTSHIILGDGAYF